MIAFTRTLFGWGLHLDLDCIHFPLMCDLEDQMALDQAMMVSLQLLRLLKGPKPSQFA
jgi:hypothetical protein